jgi:hypothetical protein
VTIGGDQDICWLQVTVHNAHGVGSIRTVCDLGK